jgi:inner membrane protein
MPSLITHPVVPIAIASIFTKRSITPPVIFAGVLCSIIPDLDVIGFAFGISYDELLGHRGITHSILFAFALGAMLSFSLSGKERKKSVPIFLFLFLSTLSHAFLDAMTNGGLGVAFFAPFSNRRYFLPWRPIIVSPIGVSAFFSPWGMRVISSELLWVWLPSAIVSGLGRYFRKLWPR